MECEILRFGTYTLLLVNKLKTIAMCTEWVGIKVVLYAVFKVLCGEYYSLATVHTILYNLYIHTVH